MTYIISVKISSEKAGKHFGHPFVWKGHIKYRSRLPSDRAGFHTWLLMMLRQEGYTPKKYGIMTIKINRTQAKGESAGFKQIFYGTVDEYDVTLGRLSESASGDVHKPVPNAPNSRQPWYYKDRDNVRPSERFKGSTFGRPPIDRSKGEHPRFGRG